MSADYDPGKVAAVGIADPDRFFKPSLLKTVILEPQLKCVVERPSASSNSIQGQNNVVNDVRVLVIAFGRRDVDVPDLL
eukprot:2690385-Rhodomonas_salina.1